MESTKEQNQETGPTAQQNVDKPEDGGDTLMQLDEQDLVDIDLEKLEEAFNRKELQTIPVEQLRKVHKVFIDSTAGSTSRLGISSDPTSELRRTSHESKRRGRKSTHQLIKEVGNYMLNSGKIQRLTEGYLNPPPNSS
jgi:hypothetical protein